MRIIILVLTIFLPGGQIAPQSTHAQMTDLEQCWAAAQEFIQQDPKTFNPKAIGIGAACASFERPGEKL